MNLFNIALILVVLAAIAAIIPTILRTFFIINPPWFNYVSIISYLYKKSSELKAKIGNNLFVYKLNFGQ